MRGDGVSGLRAVRLHYFPFFRALLYLAVAAMMAGTGVYTANSSGVPVVKWILAAFGLLVAVQILFLRATTVLVEPTWRTLTIIHRTWYGRRVATHEFAYKQVTAIIYRRLVSYKGEQQGLPGMRSWRMLAEIEQTTEIPIFPDSAIVWGAEQKGSRLAAAMEIPFRTEDASELGAWVG